MLFSYNLLKRYIDIDLSPEELAEKLTFQGLEVEEITRFEPYNFKFIKVALIKNVSKHPKADKLFISLVNDGNQEYQIVSGASNFNEGDKVCLAQIGAELPNGTKIKKIKLRGIESVGMLCSKSDLFLENHSSGIWILPKEAVIGDFIYKYLPDKDFMLNIVLTANRNDCLSLIGIAREIKIITGQKIKYNVSQIKSTKNLSDFKIDIKEPKICYRYCSRIIKNVKIKESPDCLKEVMKKFGMRSINNVVDVTNYVLFELGQPLHAYDLNKINGHVIIRRAHDKEEFYGLDHIERNLDNDTLVISDEKKIIGIAGIIGSNETEVNSDTVDLLIEAAYFEKKSIRSSVKRLQLSTEASFRFERGINIHDTELAINRCSELILKLCGGDVFNLIDEYPNKKERVKINLSLSFLNEKLASNLTMQDMKMYLKSLSFDCLNEKENSLNLLIPGYKTNILKEIHVVEEIARLYGYDKIKAEFPSIHLKVIKNKNESKIFENDLKNILVGFGFYEIFTSSFIRSNELKYFVDFEKTSLIKTKNNFNNQKEALRSNLLDGSLNIINYNVNYGEKSLRFFEVGNVFNYNNNYIEKTHLSLILYGLASDKGLYSSERYFDFFDLKGFVEKLFEYLSFSDFSFIEYNSEYFQTGYSTAIYSKDKQIGYFGKCSKNICNNYKLNLPIIYGEFNLNELLKLNYLDKSYKSIPKYPCILRDLVILVDDFLASDKVIKEIKRSDKVKSVNLLDIYKGGKHIPKGKKSLAYSIVFQDKNKTLSEEIINCEYDRIVEYLRKKCGGEMRAF